MSPLFPTILRREGLARHAAALACAVVLLVASGVSAQDDSSEGAESDAPVEHAAEQDINVVEEGSGDGIDAESDGSGEAAALPDEAGESTIDDAPVEPTIDPFERQLREVGARSRAARDAARSIADTLRLQAITLAPNAADPRLALLGDPSAGTEIAALLGIQTSELGRLETLAARRTELAQQRLEAEEARDSLRAAADAYRDRTHRAQADLVGWSFWTQPHRTFAYVLMLLSRQAAVQAYTEAYEQQVDVDFLTAAILYLDERSEILAAESADEIGGAEEIAAEIDEDRRRLETESEITEQLAADAELARMRAQQEAADARDARARRIAEQWAIIAPELERLAVDRRSEEARLSESTTRKEEFLRQRADTRARLDDILAAADDDADTTERADQLYDELLQSRRDSRERVLALRADLERISATVRDLRSAYDEAALALERAEANREGLDPDQRQALVELREAQADLADRRVALESLRREIAEGQWRLVRLQIHYYARLSDELIPHLSDSRRRQIYRLNQDNFQEARQNIRDRLIGWSLVAGERTQQVDELTDWLSRSEGIWWVLRALLFLALAFFARRQLLSRRVDWLDRRLGRLQERGIEMRALQRQLKLSELIRDGLPQLTLLLIFVIAWFRVPLDLPEWRLIGRSATKVLLFLLALTLVRTLLIPFAERVRRQPNNEDTSTFGVDLFEIELRTATLMTMTFRVWFLYTLVTSIAVDVVHFLFGDGFTPNLIDRIAFWGQVVVIYSLVWGWRHKIVDNFLKVTGSEHSAFGKFLVTHKNRLYSVVVLIAVAVYDLSLLIYRRARPALEEMSVTQRVSNFIFRKRVERAQAGMSGEAASLDEREGLSDDYCELFDSRFAIDDEVEIDREDETQRVRDAFQQWMLDPGRGSVAICGEAGMGKSTFLDRLGAVFGDELPVVQYRLDKRIVEPDRVRALLSRIIGIDTPPDEEAFIDACDEVPRQVVVVDDCHLLFLRAVGGFNALDKFLRIITRTNHRFFYVLAFEAYGWQYLNRVHDRTHYFRDVVHLAPLSGEQTMHLIERRNNAAGMLANFQNLVVSNNRGGSHYVEVIKTAAGYYRLLAEYSEGNPTVAMHYWLHSVQDAGRDRVDVSLFRRPDDRAIKQLTDNQLFVLTALVQHGRLNAKEISRVTAVDVGICQTELNYLAEVHIIRLLDDETATIAPRFFRQVLTALRNSNLLYLGNRR